MAAELIAQRADIPIILVTGFGKMLGAEDIKRIGIRKTIMKPVDRRHLAEALRQVLPSKAVSPSS